MPFGSVRQSAPTSDLMCFYFPCTIKLLQLKGTLFKYGELHLNMNHTATGIWVLEFPDVLIFYNNVMYHNFTIHFFIKILCLEYIVINANSRHIILLTSLALSSTVVQVLRLTKEIMMC